MPKKKKAVEKDDVGVSIVIAEESDSVISKTVNIDKGERGIEEE